MALADAGEAELVYCPNCDYAANTEVAECITQPQEYEVAAMEKISTPGVTTMRRWLNSLASMRLQL